MGTVSMPSDKDNGIHHTSHSKGHTVEKPDYHGVEKEKKDWL